MWSQIQRGSFARMDHFQRCIPYTSLIRQLPQDDTKEGFTCLWMAFWCVLFLSQSKHTNNIYCQIVFCSPYLSNQTGTAIQSKHNQQVASLGIIAPSWGMCGALMHPRGPWLARIWLEAWCGLLVVGGWFSLTQEVDEKHTSQTITRLLGPRFDLASMSLKMIYDLYSLYHAVVFEMSLFLSRLSLCLTAPG